MSGQEPVPCTAIDFLAYGYAGVDGWLNLFARVPRCYNVIESFPTDDPSAAIYRFAYDLGTECDLYFGVSTRNRQLVGARGEKDDCLFVPFLFTDLDVMDAERRQPRPEFASRTRPAPVCTHQADHQAGPRGTSSTAPTVSTTSSSTPTGGSIPLPARDMSTTSGPTRPHRAGRPPPTPTTLIMSGCGRTP